MALAEWHLRPDELDDLTDAMVEQLLESRLRRIAITGKLGTAWLPIMLNRAFGGGKSTPKQSNKEPEYMTGRSSGKRYKRVPISRLVGRHSKKVN